MVNEFVQELQVFHEQHPELAPQEAVVQYLANKSGDTVMARQVEGDGLVIAIPDDDDDSSA